MNVYQLDDFRPEIARRRLTPPRVIEAGKLDHELSQRGMSVEDFRRSTGIARSTLERARRGVPLSAHTLKRIARALDLAPISRTVVELIKLGPLAGALFLADHADDLGTFWGATSLVS